MRKGHMVKHQDQTDDVKFNSWTDTVRYDEL